MSQNLITLREMDLNDLCPKESFCLWQRAGLVKGDRGSTYWCVPAILSLYFLSLFLIFLFSLFFSSFLNTCFRVVIFSQSLLLPSFPPTMHGKGPLYDACLDPAFTILAFNYLCLVWVFLSTTISLLAAQPTPLTYASCTIPHYQTKKNILFVCLPWHSYLLQYGCSLSLHPLWHRLSGSNSSLLLLNGISS